jgi:hypothetical protein
MRLVFALVLFAAIGGGTALAGKKYGNPVIINPTTRTVQGGIGAARNSPDTNQHLGCVVQASNVLWMVCYATDAAGKYASCVSTDPKFVSAAQSVNGDSHLNYMFDSTGKCIQLSVYNESTMEPKL